MTVGSATVVSVAGAADSADGATVADDAATCDAAVGFAGSPPTTDSFPDTVASADLSHGATKYPCCTSDHGKSQRFRPRD